MPVRHDRFKDDVECSVYEVQHSELGERGLPLYSSRSHRNYNRFWKCIPWIIGGILLYAFFRPHRYYRHFRISHQKPLTQNSKAIVVASYDGQDTSWIDSVPLDWTVNRYMLDDVDSQRSSSGSRNQGREASVYLSYVVDNYDTLPDYVVFLQGHERAWHQPEHIVQLVRALNLSAVEQHKYVSLRCEERPACDGKTWQETDSTEEEWIPMLKAFWESTMGPPDVSVFPNNTEIPDAMPDEDWSIERASGEVSAQIRPTAPSTYSVYNSATWIALPPVLQYRCCGQFAVSRAAILQHPLSFWKRMQAPLIRDLSHYSSLTDASNFGVGLFYEVTWHLLFGDARTQATGTSCLSKNYCREVLFSDMIKCEFEDGHVGMGTQVDEWEVINCKSPFDSEIAGLEHGYGTAWDSEKGMMYGEVLREGIEDIRMDGGRLVAAAAQVNDRQRGRVDFDDSNF